MIDRFEFEAWETPEEAGVSSAGLRRFLEEAEKQKELDAINEKISAYELENADLQRILDSDDLSPYMERIAVEERNYAYPDERRFYDTSRD